MVRVPNARQRQRPDPQRGWDVKSSIVATSEPGTTIGAWTAGWLSGEGPGNEALNDMGAGCPSPTNPNSETSSIALYPSLKRSNVPEQVTLFEHCLREVAGDGVFTLARTQLSSVRTVRE